MAALITRWRAVSSAGQVPPPLGLAQCVDSPLSSRRRKGKTRRSVRFHAVSCMLIVMKAEKRAFAHERAHWRDRRAPPSTSTRVIAVETYQGWAWAPRKCRSSYDGLARARRLVPTASCCHLPLLTAPRTSPPLGGAAEQRDAHRGVALLTGCGQRDGLHVRAQGGARELGRAPRVRWRLAARSRRRGATVTHDAAQQIGSLALINHKMTHNQIFYHLIKRYFFKF